MVASIMLTLLEIPTILVYLDLVIVNKYKMHLFTPLMKIVPQKQLKTYQAIYRQSLDRKYFCVADKVDVSYTNYTGAFAIIYTVLLIMHLAMSYVSLISFWIVGLLYFSFIMFGLITIRDTRELCFYCKFMGVQNPLYLLAMFFQVESVPWLFVPTVFIIFLLVVAVRAVNR